MQREAVRGYFSSNHMCGMQRVRLVCAFNKCVGHMRLSHVPPYLFHRVDNSVDGDVSCTGELDCGVVVECKDSGHGSTAAAKENLDESGVAGGRRGGVWRRRRRMVGGER